jgi:predicted Zn-dependent protease
MAGFFTKMGHAVRKQGEGAPDFLLTHPVSSTRIAEAKSRAAKIPKAEKEQVGDPEYRALVPGPLTLGRSCLRRRPKAAASDPLAFLLFRERVRTLSGADTRALINYYASAPDTPANRYGKAIALSFAGQLDQSRELLEGLVERYPQNLTDAARAGPCRGDTHEAEAAGKRLDTLAEEHPGNRLVTQAQAEFLMLDGNATTPAGPRTCCAPWSRTATRTCRSSSRSPAPARWPGTRSGPARRTAEVALLSGNISDALWQLQGLIKRPDIDYYQRARIEARIQDVTPYALDQRKKLAPQQRPRADRLSHVTAALLSRRRNTPVVQ